MITSEPRSVPSYWYCNSTEENDPSRPTLSVWYFILFTVISALVMLSLFVGAVTMSMAASMDTMKEEAEELAKVRLNSTRPNQPSTYTLRTTLLILLLPMQKKRDERLKAQAEQVAIKAPVVEDDLQEEKASGKKDRQRKKMQKLMNRCRRLASHAAFSDTPMTRSRHIQVHDTHICARVRARTLSLFSFSLIYTYTRTSHAFSELWTGARSQRTERTTWRRITGTRV